ncbi:MAG: cytochrome c family protein [Devosiaceae bacterium]|nr:cytochrome c family protein [Devosiaceae bacterium]
MNLNLILKFIIALAGAAAFVVVVGLITNQIYEPIRDKGPGYALPEPQVAQALETPAAPAQPDAPADASATTPETPAQPATAEAPATPEQPVIAETASLPSLLASADIEAGAKVARKCIACHSLKPNLKIMVGPPIYNIVNQPFAHTEGYKYSKIMIEMAGEGNIWTYENLNEFLRKPKDFAPKTKMTYSGIKKDVDRANLLLYLQSLSENPVPLPAE